MNKQVKHYVRFYSPGSFVAETSSKPIAAWDTKLAAQMVRDIIERYNARPYGFRFVTYHECEPVVVEGEEFGVEPRLQAESGMYFLGGTLQTRAEVLAGTDPREAILRSNVECNGWSAVITTCTPWRNTQPFEEDSVQLDLEGNVIVTGKDLNSGKVSLQGVQQGGEEGET